MNFLILTSRDPGGRQTGRKQVLATTVASLRALGHHVEIAAIAKSLDAKRPSALSGVSVVRLDPPGLLRVAVNAATRFTTGSLSLNECLYYSRSVRDKVHELVRGRLIDVVVADTIRTVGLARASGATVIADLDDLLSDRYAQLASSGARGRSVIGYYGESLPRPLVPVASFVAAKVLRVEARSLRRREVTVCHQVSAVSLVAAPEARELGRRSGVRVDCLPMSVSIPPARAEVAMQPDHSMVFVGGLDYHANREAIRWFAREVLPLARTAMPDLQVHIVGFCPEDALAEFGALPGLVLRGYVDDLGAELRRHRAFVAPITCGTGVKTKVIEAMAAGLPVVTTPLGVHGLGVNDGHHCLVASTPQRFVRCMATLANHSEDATRIGSAAREFAVSGFAAAVLTSRWRRAVAHARPELTDSLKRDIVPVVVAVV